MGIEAGEMDLMLVDCGLDGNWCVETKHVNTYTDIKEGDIRGGDSPCKVNRIVTVETINKECQA